MCWVETYKARVFAENYINGFTRKYIYEYILKVIKDHLRKLFSIITTDMVKFQLELFFGKFLNSLGKLLITILRSS